MVVRPPRLYCVAYTFNQPTGVWGTGNVFVHLDYNPRTIRGMNTVKDLIKQDQGMETVVIINIIDLEAEADVEVA